jgi:hypothetical protein
MKNKSLILGLLGILLFAWNAVNAADSRFPVLVSIPIKNELTDRVESIVTRELRELPDITLVDKSFHQKGRYLISIVAVPIKLPNGTTVGVALSYVFQADHCVVHSVLTGSPDDLKDLCESLVSNFDTTFVEPNRAK